MQIAVTAKGHNGRVAIDRHLPFVALVEHLALLRHAHILFLREHDADAGRQTAGDSMHIRRNTLYLHDAEPCLAPDQVVSLATPMLSAADDIVLYGSISCSWLGIKFTFSTDTGRSVATAQYEILPGILSLWQSTMKSLLPAPFLS